MVLGRNPYDQIREESGNPGHFHEHTVAELVGGGGCRPRGHARLTENYFDHGSRKNRAYRARRATPRSLRDGITVVARIL